MAISWVRAIVLYSAVLCAVRIMGKRQISELQTSELVVTLLISDLAVIPMQDISQPLLSGLLPIAVLIAGELFLSGAMMKFSGLRKWICGNPIVVIRDGVIEQSALRRLRMTIEDLFSQLRDRDIRHLEDVAFAMVETNGTLTVLKKPECEVPSCGQFQIPTPSQDMEIVVISDGEISDTALQICGKNRQWVQSLLCREGVQQEEVFLLLVNTNGSFQILRKAAG